MMRVTNSMIVKRTKSNINSNRTKIDYTNNQMSTQKKITKPSDNPIIAIRSLRLRSTLSTITQYYENNIPDAESWMDCTATALTNMKDMLDDAYSRVVYGATDELEAEDRETILKALQSLQQQIYCEGNADYARRTVFTGYRTNQNLTFTSNKEAKDEHYKITERFDYQDIDKKSYYANQFDDTSDAAVTKMPTDAAGTQLNDVPVFSEKELNRLRLAYDKITAGGKNQENTLTISYTDENKMKHELLLSSDQSQIGSQGCTFTTGEISVPGTPPTTAPGLNITPPEGYFAVYTNGGVNTVIESSGVIPASDNGKYSVTLYKKTDWVYNTTTGTAERNPSLPASQKQEQPITTEPIIYHAAVVANPPATEAKPAYLTAEFNGQEIKYAVSNTTDLRKNNYDVKDDEIIFDQENGELIFTGEMAKVFDEKRVSFTFEYDKKGFEEGELRPENYFDCTRYMTERDDIVYENFDEEGNWKTQAIYYNIAGGQQMQINTEAREVFSSDIRRDIDELIDVVSMAMTAQTTVDEIKKKIESGNYSGTELENLNKWYDAAKKQLDYANQNMHDTYSGYISRFQGYLDTVNLEITDLGGRGERVEMTKSRMSVQQSTFKELKSINEDMDLSDLVINYTAASVAYQAALQAAAKIGKMTLLDFI